MTDGASPRALDARLRDLAHLRNRWDELLGHLAMLLRHLGLSRDMGFASFAHYHLLCRARHNLHYAERRITPRDLAGSLCRRGVSVFDAA